MKKLILSPVLIYLSVFHFFYLNLSVRLLLVYWFRERATVGGVATSFLPDFVPVDI